MHVVDRVPEVVDLIKTESVDGWYRGSAVTGGFWPIRRSSVGSAVP